MSSAFQRIGEAIFHHKEWHRRIGQILDFYAFTKVYFFHREGRCCYFAGHSSVFLLGQTHCWTGEVLKAQQVVLDWVAVYSRSLNSSSASSVFQHIRLSIFHSKTWLLWSFQIIKFDILVRCFVHEYLSYFASVRQEDLKHHEYTYAIRESMLLLLYPHLICQSMSWLQQVISIAPQWFLAVPSP